MNNALTLQLPDYLYAPLIDRAKQIGQPPEEMIIEWLELAIQHFELGKNPIRKRKSSVLQKISARAKDLGVTDLAENHDHYLYGLEKR